MSKESEAIELLREWRIKWVGEFANRDGTLSDRTDVFLSKQDIKPCPFCGSAEAFSSKTPMGNTYIHCNGCGADGPSRGEIGAIDLWNKRA